MRTRREGLLPAARPRDSAPAAVPVTSDSPASTPSATATAPSRPLAGQVVVIDPGHNGDNWAHPAVINQLVSVITEMKPCDTTGTETDAGYTEAAFNFNVAIRLARLLRAEGATVVLTRTSNHGVGPCVTQRAAIGNRAHADAAISIHADGRTDLGGLNLSTVPKVFIECGNMRNASDAAKLSSAAFRQRIAVALAAGFTAFLAPAAGATTPAGGGSTPAGGGSVPAGGASIPGAP